MTAALHIRLLDQHRVPVDPERLRLQEAAVQQLRRARLRKVERWVTRDDPHLVVEVHVQVEIAWSVLGSILDVVHNEPEVLRVVHLQRHIEVHAVVVTSSHRNRAAVIVAGICRRIVEGVHIPTCKVIVRPVVVHARHVRRNRRILRVRDLRRRGKQPSGVGYLPELIALRRRVHILIRPWIFAATVVNDDPNVFGTRRHPDVKEHAEAVGPRDLHWAAAVVALVFGRISERVHRPARIRPVRSEVVNANVVRGNRGDGLRHKTQATE